MSNDCFGRPSFVTVMNTDAHLRAMLAYELVGNAPVVLVSTFSECERSFPRPWVKGGAPENHNPQFNYEPFNSNSVNIRSWSWNYRGCWHQTCPPIVTRCWMDLNIPHCKLPNAVRRLGDLFLFAASPFALALGNLRACCPP